VRNFTVLAGGNATVSDVNNSTRNATTSTLQLTANRTYYCAVRACNDAGLCNVSFSDGVTIGACHASWLDTRDAAACVKVSLTV
jgi:hypothetical protein